MDGVTLDDFASAFGFDANRETIWTTLGKVAAVNQDGTLSVQLGGASNPTSCDAYCIADVGDVVLVVVSKGRARAVARKGGDAASFEEIEEQIGEIVGTFEPPYTEVEWVESNGKQYVYLDWKPPIATWGFEADFLIKNAFNTTQAAWNASTNASNAGFVFGTRNTTAVNDIEFGTYSANGFFRNGGSTYNTAGLFKTDKTRQQVSYRGTSLKRGDGATVTFARSSETANKPYANMTVFAYHDGVRRATSGSVLYPSTTRVYSLKFYDGDTLTVNLVGAIRKSDGITGLYDKVAGKFYPAPGMTYGDEVGDLGTADTVRMAIARDSAVCTIENMTDTRMWRAAVDLDRLEDGQRIYVTPRYAVTASYQTTELAGWDDTGNYSYVYMKLTLADGSETEWIPCYYMGTTRLTTHYGAGETLFMTYRENVLYNATATASGNSIMRAFFCDPNYNTDRYYDVYSDSVVAGLNGIKRYTVCLKDANGNWTSIVNEANKTGTADKTAYTGGLQLGKVLYTSYGSEVSAGGNSSTMWQTYVIDLRYSFNGFVNSASTQLQLRKPIYIVGTLNDSDGLFYLDTTKWWTQDSFTTGKVYLLVGSAYSSYYQCYLAADNTAYVWNGTRLVEFDYSRIRSAEGAIGAITPVVLFDDDSNTNQTITLSETAANFARMTICFKSSTDDNYSSVEVWHPNTKSVTLLSGRPYATGIYNKTSTFKINGTSIALKSGDSPIDWYIDSGVAGALVQANNICITQVIGYRG